MIRIQTASYLVHKYMSQMWGVLGTTGPVGCLQTVKHVASQDQVLISLREEKSPSLKRAQRESKRWSQEWMKRVKGEGEADRGRRGKL